MFFSISNSKDERFPKHELVHGFCVSTDAGWQWSAHAGKVIAYKGYLDSGNIVDMFPEICDNPIPKYQGNFCAIVIDENGYTLTHDINRSFPLYIANSNTLTNYPDSEFIDPVYADRYVVCTRGVFTLHKFNCYDTQRKFSNLSLDECVDYIANSLVEKVSAVKNAGLPVKVFPTTGLDSHTLMSLLIYSNINFELLDHEYFEYDEFTNKNVKYLRKTHWGYTHIHHWKEPTILSSGACGDEFLMRGIKVLGIWASYRNINIINSMDENDYHYLNFKLPKNSKILETEFSTDYRSKFVKKEYLNRTILNINVNDHQHWHLGNTITWTPFKDINYTKAVLAMDDTDIVQQGLNGEVNRRLIQKFCPDVLKFVSKQKNVSTAYPVGIKEYFKNRKE